jgi:hypothetical protein
MFAFDISRSKKNVYKERKLVVSLLGADHPRVRSRWLKLVGTVVIKMSLSGASE